MIYLGFVFAFLLSLLLSVWLRKYALKNKVALQAPRERDLHAKPIPRLGGVAIVVSFLIVILVFAFAYPKSVTDLGFPFAFAGISIDKRLLGIILAVLLLSAVMLKDDLIGVKPTWKLLTQIGAALLLILTGIGITYLNNPFGDTIYLNNLKLPVQIFSVTYNFTLWADLFFIIWVILLTNATNFIDGLDGLASGLSFIACCILAVLGLKMGQNAAALLALAAAGATLGFLPFNLPGLPSRSLGEGGAKMFLGDVGSQFLGLILAVLTVISGGKLATVLLVFGIVLLDAIYVIVKRILQGKNPLTTADQTHLHHRFLAAGFSPTSTLVTILGISLLFGLSGLLFGGKTKILLIVILTVFSLALFVFLDSRKPRKPTPK